MGSPPNSSESFGSEDLPELRSTKEGIDAQAAVAKIGQSISPALYLRFLQQFTASYEALRARPGPRGRRFVLP
jgi:hypothetical protein